MCKNVLNCADLYGFALMERMCFVSCCSAFYSRFFAFVRVLTSQSKSMRMYQYLGDRFV
jgi:hypothetical protein